MKESLEEKVKKGSFREFFANTLPLVSIAFLAGSFNELYIGDFTTEQWAWSRLISAIGTCTTAHLFERCREKLYERSDDNSRFKRWLTDGGSFAVYKTAGYIIQSYIIGVEPYKILKTASMVALVNVFGAGRLQGSLLDTSRKFFGFLPGYATSPESLDEEEGSSLLNQENTGYGLESQNEKNLM